MSFIYLISNDINDKKYVGKTNLTIEERFKSHLSDSKKRICEIRPLYRAINKYGVEHFNIEKLEECSPEEASEREMYWIEKLGTYHYGYNATRGGDGKNFFDYEKIFQQYLLSGTLKETASICGCSIDTVQNVVRQHGVDAQENTIRLTKERLGKPVKMLPEGQVFSTLNDAARYLQQTKESSAKEIRGIAKHIREAADKKRAKAYNHEWKWAI